MERSDTIEKKSRFFPTEGDDVLAFDGEDLRGVWRWRVV
jgi:hypothetical protein